MRLLLAAPSPPSANGHGAIPMVLHALVEGLTRRHDLTLVVGAGPGEDELSAAEDLLRRGIDARIAWRHTPVGLASTWGRRGRFAARWSKGREPWRTVWYREGSPQQLLDEVARGRRFDAVIAEDNAMAPYRYPLGTPALLTEHEVRAGPWAEVRGAGSPGGRRGLVAREDWRRWRGYQRRLWRRFDRLQVFTEADARAAAAVAPEVADRIRVTPFGVALPWLHGDAEEQPGSLAFVGNFSHPPNVDAALWLVHEIMPRVWARRPATTLALVGPLPPTEVRHLAGDRVAVTGAVPDADTELRRAAVVLAPIRTGGGMRMKVLRSLALGRPVVTTSLGAAGLSAGGRSHLVVADTADAFADATAALLENPSERRGLAQEARHFVERHHSPQAYAARVERVLDEITA